MGSAQQRRCVGFIRMWRIVVLLRCQPHTIDSLAQKLGVCSRTIRRDLDALQAVPLPITPRFANASRTGIQRGQPNVWSCAELTWASLGGAVDETIAPDPAVAGTVGDGTPPQFAP